MNDICAQGRNPVELLDWGRRMRKLLAVCAHVTGIVPLCLGISLGPNTKWYFSRDYVSRLPAPGKFRHESFVTQSSSSRFDNRNASFPFSLSMKR
jgi:hypothetical protein